MNRQEYLFDVIKSFVISEKSNICFKGASHCI